MDHEMWGDEEYEGPPEKEGLPEDIKRKLNSIISELEGARSKIPEVRRALRRCKMRCGIASRRLTALAYEVSRGKKMGSPQGE